MTKTLFQIEQSMYNLLNYGVDDETGECIETEEEFNALYESIQLDMQTKLDNTNSLTKIIDSEMELIDKEIKRLQSEKKSRERKKEWLMKNIDNFIRRQYIDEDGVLDEEGLHKYKLTLPHSKISYRKSESVNVYDESKLPNEYQNVVIEKKPNKVKIKEAIKKGETVDGANISVNYNLNIK